MRLIEQRADLRCSEKYMKQRSGNRKKRKEPGDHLSWEDRLTIERMLNRGCSKQAIAEAIGSCRATVYNEIKRGQYEHLNSDLTTEMRYSPEIAEQKYCEHLSRTGPQPKLIKDPELRSYIEKTILEKGFSPEAVLISGDYAKQEFEERITSVNTIYKGIDLGFFPKLTRFDLADGWHKKKTDKKPKNKECSERKKEEKRTIEDRPKEIDDRTTFGNWEGDCVMGQQGNKKCLLVFIERLTRMTIIEELAYHTADEVRKAVNRIEKRMGKAFYDVFQTITFDNGSEFSDWDSVEQALYRKGKRTNVYFCHPNSPQERGSNECNNKMVRRRFPKGSDFDRSVTCHSVKAAERWINDYPRKIFAGETAADRFWAEIDKHGIDLQAA
ncbi:IS30 family transposase [Emergencia sp. 1XD21-10]|uniref:IS30 family transposase n=1 Tax=Emergencia sp. 1XD21-10 TaxID=2304569 RepID=UPI00137A479D|nr:IS30 family transposase [Emergencia sp. 1XD21-10]